MITTVGPHRVRHGDLLTGLGELAAPPVDLIYTDPPWGGGHLKYFQTINEQQTGTPAVRPPSLADFLAAFFGLLKIHARPEALVFVEYGLRWEGPIAYHAARVGLQRLALATPCYQRTRRYHLHVFAWQSRPVPAGWVERLATMKGGVDNLCAAVDPFGVRPGMTILDPCCGLGTTARYAVKRGLTFYGNELNEARLARTVAILRGKP